jgi:hypothetical protein
MAVRPNPARDLATVRLQGAMPRRAVLFDVFGKKVLGQNVSAPEFELQLAELPAGIYLLNVETERGRIAWKIAVQR